MIADWEVNGVFLADKLKVRHPGLFADLRETLVAHGVDVRVLEKVRDIWARDYCPIQVGVREFVQFRYEPDYLIKYPELRTGREVAQQFQDLGQCQHSDINLDGGNVVASRNKVILTDKIYKENRNWNPAKLRDELQKLLQVEQLIVIPKEPGDYVGHADGMVRFIDETSVLVSDYALVCPDFGDRVAKVLRQHGLVIEYLPYFLDEQFQDGIQSAVGCYVNFLRTKQILVAPIFNHRSDQDVLKKLTTLFPTLPVVPLDCTSLAREGGVLNCVTAGFLRTFADATP